MDNWPYTPDDDNDESSESELGSTDMSMNDMETDPFGSSMAEESEPVTTMPMSSPAGMSSKPNPPQKKAAKKKVVKKKAAVKKAGKKNPAKKKAAPKPAKKKVVKKKAAKKKVAKKKAAKKKGRR